MTPLTTEEIDALAVEQSEYACPYIIDRYKRLFYTARLGAEFVRVTTNQWPPDEVMKSLDIKSLDIPRSEA